MSDFVAADLIMWQVEYTDGSVESERDGKKYGGIDRARFRKFQLTNAAGQVIFETWPPVGKSGQNFVYRRRIRIMENGQKMTLFVLGYLPDGPAFAVNVEDGTYRELPNGFDPADQDMYPPDPMPGEVWFAEDPSARRTKPV